jgi:transcriptional regulator EpsA
MSDIDPQKKPPLIQTDRRDASRRQNDGLGFLATAEGSLRIDGHMDLCEWLQGDVQQFIPHEVMIAAWGDFDANNLRFDVISPLAPFRTEVLYALCSSNTSTIGRCRNGLKAAGAKNCGVFPFLTGLRRRWHEEGCTPYAVLRSTNECVLDFVSSRCDPDLANLLRSMRSSLIHGFSDHREKLECIYVFLSTQDLSGTSYRRSLRFLLPYLDHTLRQVSHLPVQAAEIGQSAAEPDESDDSISLSPREKEIMDWVRIGKTNYEIGVILNISAFTVKNHLQRIFRKLGTSSRAQAVDKLSRGKNTG